MRDLPRLGGDPGALFRRQVLQRPHVVQPIRQLDDDDPRVLGDRQEQLAVVLDLFFGGGAEGEVGDLGEPVDQAGHFGAELLGHVFPAHVGVFHDVVQQRRHDRGGIEKLTDQDGGHGNAVRDKLLPAHPLLAPVGARAVAERAVDQLEIEPVGVTLQRGPKIGGKVQQRFVHSSPRVAKLVKRSPATITWSYTGTSSSSPAATSWRVTAWSSAEGVGSPLG